MPASSAMRASRRLSGQLPDQRSGTLVTARPDEQLAPNSPICSRLSPYMAMRLRMVASRGRAASLLRSFTGFCSLRRLAAIGSWLVLRFRISHHFAAPSERNSESKEHEQDQCLLVRLMNLNFLQEFAANG